MIASSGHSQTMHVPGGGLPVSQDWGSGQHMLNPNCVYGNDRWPGGAVDDVPPEVEEARQAIVQAQKDRYDKYKLMNEAFKEFRNAEKELSKTLTAEGKNRLKDFEKGQDCIAGSSSSSTSTETRTSAVRERVAPPAQVEESGEVVGSERVESGRGGETKENKGGGGETRENKGVKPSGGTPAKRIEGLRTENEEVVVDRFPADEGGGPRFRTRTSTSTSTGKCYNELCDAYAADYDSCSSLAYYTYHPAKEKYNSAKADFEAAKKDEELAKKYADEAKRMADADRAERRRLGLDDEDYTAANAGRVDCTSGACKQREKFFNRMLLTSTATSLLGMGLQTWFNVWQQKQNQKLGYPTGPNPYASIAAYGYPYLYGGLYGAAMGGMGAGGWGCAPGVNGFPGMPGPYAYPGGGGIYMPGMGPWGVAGPWGVSPYGPGPGGYPGGYAVGIQMAAGGYPGGWGYPGGGPGGYPGGYPGGAFPPPGGYPMGGYPGGPGVAIGVNVAVGGYPMGGYPMGGQPMGPMGGYPMGGYPGGIVGPPGGYPMGGYPMGGQPMGPMGGYPMGGMPVGMGPMGMGPMGGYPMGGQPMGGYPGGYAMGGVDLYGEMYRRQQLASGYFIQSGQLYNLGMQILSGTMYGGGAMYGTGYLGVGTTFPGGGFPPPGGNPGGLPPPPFPTSGR